MFLKFPILKLKKSDWNFNKELYIEHLRIGLPMGFQMSVLSLGVIAMQYVLNSFGSNAIAAFTTAMRVDQAFCNAYLALGSSAAVFSAQNFGAKKIARIRQGASASVLLAASISIVTIIVLSLFSAQLISLFMDEPNQEVISLAVEYLHIIMFFFFFLGLLLIFRNILQGMGNVLVPLLSGTVELVARVFGAFVLAHYFNYTGICFATPMAWLFGAIVLYLCYRISLKKNIKKMRVLKI